MWSGHAITHTGLVQRLTELAFNSVIFDLLYKTFTFIQEFDKTYILSNCNVPAVFELKYVPYQYRKPVAQFNILNSWIKLSISNLLRLAKKS